MKKYYIAIFTLILSINLLSQQSPYYDGTSSEVSNETGMTLFATLANLTANEHTNMLSYSEARECLKVIDLEPGQSDNVLLIYGFSNNMCPSSSSDDRDHLRRDKDDFGGGQTCEWNREHTFANSLANPDLDSSGDNGTAYSDAHNLRASDVGRNGERGNLKFTTGSGNSYNTGSGWYPGDDSTGGTDWRGDAARIVMYMYLRYGTQCYPSLVANGTTNSIDSNMIDLLLDWNAADPVSAYEDVRNTYHENTSNTYGQGNRNPFIDNPHLATRIWGGTPAEDRWGIFATDTEDPSVPMNLSVSNETSSTIDLDWTASTDNTGVTGYDIYVDGMFDSSSATNSHTITGLSASTPYSFTVLAKDAANNMSAQSSSVNGTTTAGGSGSGTTLYFSEYMEGSSLNKALEIANYTGAIVDPNDAVNTYTLKISTNGNATWNSTYTFPMSASINDGDVYVIGNTGLALCTGVVDDSNDVITGFNGNDAIGLFKNDILIDILGTLGDGTTYASNTTLVRKTSIDSPNTTYTASEWDTFASNTCTDLGVHTQTLGTNNYNLSEIKLYPNPTSGDVLNIDANQNLSITIFDLLGKKLIIDSVSSSKKQVDISKLKSGAYFIKLSSEDGTATRKFIKQ
jgi:endonuclease I